MSIKKPQHNQGNTNPGPTATAAPDIENPVPNEFWHDWNEHAPLAVTIIEQVIEQLKPDNDSPAVRLQKLKAIIEEHNPMPGWKCFLLNRKGEDALCIADFVIQCSHKPGRFSLTYVMAYNLVLEEAATELQIVRYLMKITANNTRYQLPY